MTHLIDILGRPPVRRADFSADETDIGLPDEDWRGEHYLKVEKSDSGGGGFNMKHPSINGRLAAQIQRREKVGILHGKGMTDTDIAASIGCSASTVNLDLRAIGLR